MYSFGSKNNRIRLKCRNVIAFETFVLYTYDSLFLALRGYFAFINLLLTFYMNSILNMHSTLALYLPTSIYPIHNQLQIFPVG